VVKAAFVLLLKHDPKSVLLAVRALSSLEVAFNHQYHYPLVVFHEGDFEEVYKQQLHSSSFSGNITFSPVVFSTPQFLDQSRIPEIVTAYDRNFSVGYRHMCRFYAGQIAHMESLAQYDWMWRIDDDSIYICPIGYDPFLYMQKNGKRYGYAVEWQEADETISWGLWEATRDYMKTHNIDRKHLNGYINCVGTYNRCHFWNNFEIVDLRLLRSLDYTSYFDHLDRLGGIYYHRWGDALIRTLGVLLFTSPSEVHKFVDIGYAHNTACINPCHWKPKTPADGIPCNHLPTGRDSPCEPARRYFQGHRDALHIEFVVDRIVKISVIVVGVVMVTLVLFKRYQQRLFGRRLVRTE